MDSTYCLSNLSKMPPFFTFPNVSFEQRCQWLIIDEKLCGVRCCSATFCQGTTCVGSCVRFAEPVHVQTRRRLDRICQRIFEVINYLIIEY